MGKRILSILLSVCMVLTLLPVAAMAEDANASMSASGEIIAFAPLDETEKSVATGTAIEDLGLPETLTATVRTAAAADSGTSQEPAQDSENPEEDSTSGNSAEASSSSAVQGNVNDQQEADDSGTSQEPVINSENPEEDSTSGNSTVATTSSAIQGNVNEQQESADPEWEETSVDVPVTWTSEPEYNGNENGEYVFTPVIEGYTVSADLPEITVTVGTQPLMTALRTGTPVTYGDFSVSVDEDGAAPTHNDGVLTFGTAGEYTVGMADGKTSTSNVIKVTADGVKLNLVGVNITAPQGAGSDNGAAALTVTTGTVTLNVIVDSSLTGGAGGSETDPDTNYGAMGGCGISGNIAVTGTATLTVTGGTSGQGMSLCGIGIIGNVNVSGEATLIARSGSGNGGIAISSATQYGGGTITVGDGYTVKAGTDAASATAFTGTSTNLQYVAIEPIIFTVAENTALEIKVLPIYGDPQVDNMVASQGFTQPTDGSKTANLYWDSAKTQLIPYGDNSFGIGSNTLEKIYFYATETGTYIFTATFIDDNDKSSNYTIKVKVTGDTPPDSLPTAEEYASASPAAASDTDYVLDSVKKTLTIKTAKGAAFWSANGKNYLDYTILLAKDINVSAFQWTPVGTDDGSFSGSFNGQGHTISSLTINTTDVRYAGLFGYASGATIKNLTVSGSVTASYVSGECYAGGIVGYNTEGSTIANCANYAAVSVSTSGNSSYANAKGGGIAALNSGTIENCRNSGAVTAANNSTNASPGYAYAGGICAFNNSGAIANSYNIGTSSATGATEALTGGICAKNCATITNCYSTNASKVTTNFYGSATTTGCGTFSDNGGVLTAGTADNCGSAQTLSYGNGLLAALNAWVGAKASGDYYTWQADSTSDPVNKGYPVFGEKWEAPATKYNVWVGNVQVTSANSNGITGDGITGTVTYNHDTNTLTLDGATITSGHLIENFDGPAGIDAEGNLNLELKNDNTITGISPSSGKCSFAVYNDGNLTIMGNGTLNATGGDTSDGGGYGLYITNSLSIQNDATVNVNSGNATNGNCWGVLVGDALTIQGSASVNVTGGTSTGENGSSYGVYVFGYTKVKDSASLSATSGAAEYQSYGIFISNNNSFEISGGTVTASTTDNDGASEGSAAINKKPILYFYKPAPVVMTSRFASGTDAVRNTLSDINIPSFKYIRIVPSSLPTAAEYASASPAAASNTDYVLDSVKKTLTIKTAKGAAFWSASSKNYLDYTILLADDIDVSNFLWTPVGTGADSFTGSFNGQGHTITGLTVDIYAGNEAVYAGLFGMTSGSIKNVGLAKASIVVSNTSTDSKQVFAGGLAGEAFDGAITNCFVMGGTVSASSGYGSYAGGLVGFASDDITVSNCYSTSSVTTSGTGGHSGGVAGCIGAGTIKDCYYLNGGTGMPEKGVGRVYPNCEPVITGCGTIGSNNSTLAAGTEEQFTSQQTLAYGTILSDALNVWVYAKASGDYYTWQDDTGSINGGYPVFDALWGTTTPVFDNCFKDIHTKKPDDPGSYMGEYHYDFDGWYTEQNGDGTKLGDSDDGTAGTRYYAKWIKNGKTVRTTALDLTDISESNLYRSTKSGDVYTNAAEGWTWYAAKTTVGSNTYAANTLVLSGLNINTAATATALKVPGGTTIVLTEGTINSARSGYTSSDSEAVYTYGVYGAGALNIKGGGTLSAFAGTAAYTKSNNSYGGFSYGIYSAGALNITEGIISAKGGFSGPTAAENKSYGIYSNSTIDISGGTVTGNGGGGKAESGGIAAEGDIKITGGVVAGQGGAVNLRTSIGIIARTAKISVTGGTVSATGGASTGTDDSSASVGVFADKVEISQGTVTATGGNAASGNASCGIAAISSVTVTGGRVTAKNGATGVLSAAINVYQGTLTVGGTEKLATIENATDGTNAITSSSGSIASKKLVMSGSDAVKVSFATYAITANAATNGSYTVKVDGSAVTSAQSDEKVVITPTASSDYELDTISVYKTGEANASVAVSNNTFTMPAYAVTIDVTFKAAITSLDLTGVGCNVATGKLTGTTANMEYSLDGGSTWKPCTQGETTNLTFTAGTVKVRQKDKTTNERTVATIAAPAASTTPTLDSKTANSVTLHAIAGYEYSKDGGTTWQISNVFSGLNGSTAYSFVARIKATAATLAGTTSTALNVTTNGTSSGGDGGSTGGSSSDTPSKPTAPVSGSTENKATVDDKGNASVSLTDNNITDAIADAKAAAAKKGVNAGDITAVIHVTTGGKDANTVTVNLPKTTQEQVIGNKISNVQLVIDSSDLTLGINRAAVTEINQQAKADVQLSATRMNSSKLSGDARSAIGNRPTFDFKATYGSGKSVSNFGNGSVSVEIPYTLQKGEVAGNVCAVYVDANGKVAYLDDSSYDAKRGTVVFSTSHFSTYGVAYNVGSHFTDINSHWAKDDILFAANRGLITGTSATTFSPNGSMTRGMFVTALGRLANADTSAYKQSSFTDVKANAYYMGYIEWAVKNNILAGVGGGKFDPDGLVTREQMAVMMDKYATATGFQLPEVHAQNTFADNAKISAWAAASVKRIQMAGILQGKNNNYYDPQGTATRAEVSAVLRRYVELAIFSDTAQGWVKNDSGQWMFFKDGKALTGWQTVDGKVYCFDSKGGAFANGWKQNAKGEWLFLSPDGSAVTGWKDIGAKGNTKRYYFDTYGVRIAGKWLQINGKWYYFYADGSLAKSTKIDSYLVDENGVRKTK